MVRRDLVAAKAGRARAWLNASEPAFQEPLDEFLRDTARRDLALFYVFLAIQECIDIAAHWVADEGWGVPDEAGSTFDVMAEHGLIDGETATLLRAATGLRNRIGHGYAMLDYARVHREAREGLPALRRFLLATLAGSERT